MTTTFTRKGIERWGGQPLPPEIAYGVRDAPGCDIRMVSWDEVMEARRDCQREILRRKRQGLPERRAYRLEVSYFDQWAYGGWHAFLHGLHDYRWLDKPDKHLRGPIMAAFGVLDPTLFETEGEYWRFKQWKMEFAEQYKRREQDGRPVGVAYLWWDGDDGEIEPVNARSIVRARAPGD